jgi:adenylate cyclase class IV
LPISRTRTPCSRASPVREVELKGVVTDVATVRARAEKAGAALLFAGRMEDRRYDTPDGRLASLDQVLRLRIYRNIDGARATLDWKGPASVERGYKIREEFSTTAGEPDALAGILRRLGYVVTREIDREVAQYQLAGAVIRFERYPRMDVLLEVEGSPEAIERAIAAVGLRRADFNSDRLLDFVQRFEARTGERAALADSELSDHDAD